MATDQTQSETYDLVVGIDYSRLGDLALETACDVARGHPKAHLHLVHVERAAEPSDSVAPGGDVNEASSRLHGHVEAVLKRWSKSQPEALPFERLTTHIRSGGEADAIAQLASDVEANLVVVGTHGHRGARRYLLGSVAEATVRLAPCAVLVVREADASVPKIEPPCPRCLETRRASNGEQLWCEQHAAHHDRRHTHHYRGASNARQSGFLIHTR